MSAAADEVSAHDARGISVGRRALVVVGCSLLLGGVTSYAQGFLPDAVRSLANSPSGWTVLTAALVGSARPGWRSAAALGAASFVGLVLGYTIASELRGLTYDPLFWSAIGLVAGPFVGTAAAALGRPDRRAAAVGSGLLAGVLIADGIHGLTVVAETTSPVYWTLAILTGVLLAVIVAATRLRGVRRIALQVGTLLVVTALASAAYAVLG